MKIGQSTSGQVRLVPFAEPSYFPQLSQKTEMVKPNSIHIVYHGFNWVSHSQSFPKTQKKKQQGSRLRNTVQKCPKPVGPDPPNLSGHVSWQRQLVFSNIAESSGVSGVSFQALRNKLLHV